MSTGSTAEVHESNLIGHPIILYIGILNEGDPDLYRGSLSPPHALYTAPRTCAIFVAAAASASSDGEIGMAGRDDDDRRMATTILSRGVAGAGGHRTWAGMSTWI